MMTGEQLAEPVDHIYRGGLWCKQVDIQAFKQKQMLASVSVSDGIVEMLTDTINYCNYYQGILLEKFILKKNDRRMKKQKKPVLKHQY